MLSGRRVDSTCHLAVLARSAVLLLCSCDGCRTCTIPTVLAPGIGASASATLHIPRYETAEYTNVLVDWSAVDADLYCEPLDPVADIDTVGLTRWPRFSEENVESALAADAWLQSDTNGYASCEPGAETACNLSEFAFGGTAYDIVSTYGADAGTFLMTLETGAAPFQSIRSLAFLAPVAESDVDEVFLTPTCPMADVTVDLTSGDPLLVDADGGEEAGTLPDSATCVESAGPSWPIDWSALETSATGAALSPTSINLVVIARYAMAVEDLELQFRDREALAAERYTLGVDNQTSADLADATSALVVPFSGFSGEGFWLIELQEGNTLFSIPAYMSVVESG